MSPLPPHTRRTGMDRRREDGAAARTRRDGDVFETELLSFPAAEHGGGGGESSPVRVLAHTTRLVRCRRAWACGVGGAGGAGGAGVRREPMTRRGTVGSSRYRPRHCCHRATTPRRNEVNQLTAADSTRGARVCGPACSPRCAPGALFHQHRLSSPVRRSIFACILRRVTPQACGAGVQCGA